MSDLITAQCQDCGKPVAEGATVCPDCWNCGVPMGEEAVQQTMTLAPEWLANADEEERAELEHLIGVPLTGDSDANLAATASQLLAAIRTRQAELTRHENAEAAEIQRIRARYATPKQRIKERISALEGLLGVVAEGLDYGKKKSRIVGNGTVGFRTTPERVAVTDSTALLAWAAANAPTLIKVETKQSVPQAAVKDHLTSTGELPEGCELIPSAQKLVYSIAEA